MPKNKGTWIWSTWVSCLKSSNMRLFHMFPLARMVLIFLKTTKKWKFKIQSKLLGKRKMLFLLKRDSHPSLLLMPNLINSSSSKTIESVSQFRVIIIKPTKSRIFRTNWLTTRVWMKMSSLIKMKRMWRI